MFPIKKGSTDIESIKKIQKRLNSTVDGIFGNNTEILIKKFQKQNQLIQDGIVGELTWGKLFNTIVDISPISDLIKNVLNIAKSQMGLGEKTGHNDGPTVAKYLKSVGLPEGYSYCQAFVYWCFNEACKILNIKNPVPKTAGVLDCYRKGKQYEIHDTPKSGDQFIMDFGKEHGHTGIVIGIINGKVHTYEANTSEDPSIPTEDREGGGNFERLRGINTIKAFLRYS